MAPSWQPLHVRQPQQTHGIAVPWSCCRLESDIAVLEQHLETMRATYQLNAEKLEYNYRVLLERDAGMRSEGECVC